MNYGDNFRKMYYLRYIGWRFTEESRIQKIVLTLNLN